MKQGPCASSKDPRMYSLILQKCHGFSVPYFGPKGKEQFSATSATPHDCIGLEAGGLFLFYFFYFFLLLLLVSETESGLRLISFCLNIPSTNMGHHAWLCLKK